MLAGIADVGPFSLRELAWRADLTQLMAWDHTAALTAAIVGSQSRKRVAPWQFHPIRRRARQVSEGRMLQWMKEAKDILPHELTEEEKDARWEEICNAVDADR